jgi:hypothetical protein
MSRSHLLVEKAFIYDVRKSLEDPPGSVYDNALGAWLWTDGNEFLVKSNDSGRPKPTTKKFDIETGEDLKGA